MDEIVCQGQCPFCGRWIDLTWQRAGDADVCPCGVEAVLVVKLPHMLRWYWRDPKNLPEGSGTRPRPEWARRPMTASVPGLESKGPVQLPLFAEGA